MELEFLPHADNLWSLLELTILYITIMMHLAFHIVHVRRLAPPFRALPAGAAASLALAPAAAARGRARGYAYGATA